MCDPVFGDQDVQILLEKQGQGVIEAELDRLWYWGLLFDRRRDRRRRCQRLRQGEREQAGYEGATSTKRPSPIFQQHVWFLAHNPLHVEAIDQTTQTSQQNSCIIQCPTYVANNLLINQHLVGYLELWSEAGGRTAFVKGSGGIRDPIPVLNWRREDVYAHAPVRDVCAITAGGWHSGLQPRFGPTGRRPRHGPGPVQRAFASETPDVPGAKQDLLEPTQASSFGPGPVFSPATTLGHLVS